MKKQETKRTRVPDGSEEAAHNRSLIELRNKIRRTVYAIVDYHLMSTEFRFESQEELDKLANDALKAIYQGAGFNLRQ